MKVAYKKLHCYTNYSITMQFFRLYPIPILPSLLLPQFYLKFLRP